MDNQRDAFAAANIPAGLCIGREGLCKLLLEDARFRSAAVLLGGPQSGVTSILRAASAVVPAAASTTEALWLASPFYFVLKLPPPLPPAAFFRFLTARTAAVCAFRIKGFPPQLPFPSADDPDDDSLELLTADLVAIFKAAGDIRLNPIYLL